GTVTLGGDVEGALGWRDGLRFEAAGPLRLATAAGSVRGEGALRVGPALPPWYRLDARIADLDPGRILGDPRWGGALTGRVEIDGAGTTLETLDGRLALALEDSRFAGRSFSALDADLTAAGPVVSGTAALAAGGTLRTSGTVTLGGEPTASLTVSADRLDLRRLLPTAPPTDLTAALTLTGSGNRPDALAADVTLDLGASSVTVGETERPLPPQTLDVAVRPAGASPRLLLDGDALTARVEGDFEFVTLLPLIEQWTAAIGRTVEDVRPATLHQPGTEEPGPRVLPGAVRATAVVPQSVRLAVELRRPDLIEASLPGLPTFAPGTSLTLDATLATDSLALAAVAAGDSLRAGRVSSRAFSGRLAIDTGYAPSLADRAEAALTVKAAELQLPVGPTSDATVSVRYADRRAEVAVENDAVEGPERVALDATLGLAPERIQVAIWDLGIETEGQAWRAVDAPKLDVYADAAVVRGLVVERETGKAQAEEPQRLAFDGVLSPAPTDTLHVRAQALDLDEALSLVRLRNFFGGRLDAELAVAGALGQPQVVGEAEVERFTFAGRRAGHAALTSRFAPERDALDVNLRLEPDGDPLSVENDFRVVGTVRLPGRAPDGTRTPGALDLGLDIDRLDLFVFDWLFPAVVSDAGGYATGQGRITGTPRVPLFDAALDVHDGTIRVPDFGLRLFAEGTVRVDREGFHLRNVFVEDKAGGRALIRGDVLFNDYRYFSLDLAADLAELEIIDVPASSPQAQQLPFYGHVRASGSATLTGPLDATFLRSVDAVTTADSEIFIPVTASGPTADAGFLVFADSTGAVPEFAERKSVLAQRPEDERPFLDGLDMNLNVTAPPGATVHLVFDPVIGDEIIAVGSAQLQVGIREGEFLTFGVFDVERGRYLFTAGDVFTRRFELEPGGTLRWDGDPIDARLDLPATYRTRASLAGLGLAGVDERQRIPLVIGLDVSGRVLAPLVDLSIELDEQGRDVAGAEALRRRLNETDRQAEYATSVLLTNSFLLAPTERYGTVTEAADELLYTSLSQLVSTRLNLFLNQALGSDNLDVEFGVQQGADFADLDLTY
ncbi:MAG: translocation/assembly module TamB domain-containing protein, partial [Rhodothermales bacterium]|nr:translocation/assembly module TamB domain-containing protein [Rhodothermales bacterium]